MPKLIEVKTSELEGEALNWAMAQAEGVAVKLVRGGRYGEPDSLWFVAGGFGGYHYNWAGDWARLGPLLDSYAIDFATYGDGSIRAAQAGAGLLSYCDGPTRLTAACRLIVRIRLGRLVLIPVELVAP